MSRPLMMLLLLLPEILLAQGTSQPPVPPASPPASQPANPFIAYPSGPADLRSAGFHKLIYQWSENGQPRRLPLAIFLPQGYGQDDRRWPMLTFLAGLGDRGADPGNAMAVGVPLEIGRSTELSQWFPMIVLVPQCPSDRVWDSPGMGELIVRLVHAVADRLAVDSSRLYVTGFSDGGKGSWVLAAHEPGLFAVTAPIVSREYFADQTAARLAGTGIACLIISGQKDPKSEPASARMAEALGKQHVDVTYASVPDAAHFIWRAFYSQREFYQWLLLHRRGDAPPKDRPTADQFIKLFQSRQQLAFNRQMADYRLQRGLDRFEPYWFIDNCDAAPDLGFRSTVQDRPNVYACRPLSADIPCRLQTTRQLPADKPTELLLEVGHAPKGQWELVVRVNEQEQVRTVVDDQTAPSGWLQLKVGLADYAGKEVRLQLIQSDPGHGNPIAYWSQIKLTPKAP